MKPTKPRSRSASPRRGRKKPRSRTGARARERWPTTSDSEGEQAAKVCDVNSASSHGLKSPGAKKRKKMLKKVKKSKSRRNPNKKRKRKEERKRIHKRRKRFAEGEVKGSGKLPKQDSQLEVVADTTRAERRTDYEAVGNVVIKPEPPEDMRIHMPMPELEQEDLSPSPRYPVARVKQEPGERPERMPVKRPVPAILRRSYELLRRSRELAAPRYSPPAAATGLNPLPPPCPPRIKQEPIGHLTHPLPSPSQSVASATSGPAPSLICPLPSPRDETHHNMLAAQLGVPPASRSLTPSTTGTAPESVHSPTLPPANSSTPQPAWLLPSVAHSPQNNVTRAGTTRSVSSGAHTIPAEPQIATQLSGLGAEPGPGGDPHTWTETQVGLWIAQFQKEYQQYQQVIIDNGVTGEVILLDEFNVDWLVAIGIPDPIHRLRIKQEIKKLKANCASAME